MKGLLIFLGGLVVGVTSGFLTSNYILERKYNKLYDEEVEVIKERFEKKYKKDISKEDLENCGEEPSDEVKKEMAEKLTELGYSSPSQKHNKDNDNNEDDDYEEIDEEGTTYKIIGNPVLVTEDEADIYIEEEHYDDYVFTYSLSDLCCYCGDSVIDIIETFGSFELFDKMKYGNTYYIVNEKEEEIFTIKVVG